MKESKIVLSKREGGVNVHQTDGFKAAHSFFFFTGLNLKDSTAKKHTILENYQIFYTKAITEDSFLSSSPLCARVKISAS